MCRLIIYLIFFGFFAPINATNAKADIETVNHWEKYRRKMAVLDAFDSSYNRVHSLEDYEIQLGTLGGVDYSYFCHEYKKDEDLWQVFPIDINELRLHRRYIFFSVLSDITSEQAFVNMYAAYLSFWATIEFRICSLIRAGKTAKDCEKLSRLMHWFTFLYFKRKIFDFSKIGSLSEIVKKGAELKCPEVAKSFWNYITGLTAKKTAEKLQCLTLDAIMDEKYIEKHRKTEPESKVTGSLCARKYRKESKLKPRDRETDEKEWHNYLWNEVMEMLPPDIVEIENYFETVINNGHKIKEIRDLKELIPSYKLSSQIAGIVSIELMKIKGFDSSKPRKLYEIDSSTAILRSNPIEIIRYLEKMKFREDQFKNKSEIEKRTIEQKAGNLKENHRFHLT